MAEASVFPRQTGIRPGVGVKPARPDTSTLTDAARTISPGVGEVVRVVFAASMTISAAVRYGRFDCQRLTLLCAANDGMASLVNADGNNVSLDIERAIDDWVPFPGDTLSLVWDARERLWFETGRVANG